MNTWRWLNAPTSFVQRESSIPLPNTSPDMSPMPTTVRSSSFENSERPIREGVDLPVVAVALVGGRRERADEGAPADARRHVAELGEPPVGPGGGEVVDTGFRRERTRSGQLLGRLEQLGVDCGGEAIDELLRQGYLPAALQIRQ